MTTRRGTKLVHEGQYAAAVKLSGSSLTRDGRPICPWMMPRNWMRSGRRYAEAISREQPNLGAFISSPLLPYEFARASGERLAIFAFRAPNQRLKPTAAEGYGGRSLAVVVRPANKCDLPLRLARQSPRFVYWCRRMSASTPIPRRVNRTSGITRWMKERWWRC